MGIKHLKGLLDTISQDRSAIKTYDNFQEYIDNEFNQSTHVAGKGLINHFLNKNNKQLIIAIDAILYIYRYKTSFPDFIIGFLNQIIKFKENKTKILYVFDGIAPTEKKDIINLRNKRKLKKQEKLLQILEKRNLLNSETKNLLVYNEDSCGLIPDCDIGATAEKGLDNSDIDLDEEIYRLNNLSTTVTTYDISLLKEFLLIIGIPFVEAIGEADALIAELYKRGIVNGCLSEDMDMLVRGCDHLLQIVKGKVKKYDLKKILLSIGLTRDQFIDMCIILGSDYVKYSPRLKSIEIYRMIQKYYSLEIFIEAYSKIDSKILKYKDAYLKAREIFKSSYPGEIVLPESFKLNTKHKLINRDVLYNFISQTTSLKTPSILRIMTDLIYPN